MRESTSNRFGGSGYVFYGYFIVRIRRLGGRVGIGDRFRIV